MLIFFAVPDQRKPVTGTGLGRKWSGGAGDNKFSSKIFCGIENYRYLCSPKFYGLEAIYKYVTAYQNQTEILRLQPG